MSSSSLPAFKPTCPSGSTWYACATGDYFVGCCGRNPCQSTCAAGDLYPASFDPEYHGTFKDAQCGSLSLFYTCAFNTPPFLGCCKSNPCAAGICSAGNLAPAYLDTPALRIEYGAVGGTSSTSSARATSTSATRTSSTLSTTASGTTGAVTATRDAAATLTPKKDGPPVAAIAGGAAGGAFALALAIGLLIYYCCHAKKSRKSHEETVIRRQSDLPAMMAVQGKDQAMNPPEAPPNYTSPDHNDYYGQHAGQYHYQQPQHQFAPQPQELPIEPRSPAFFPRKPIVGHQRNLSELSGDTAIRSELDSPLNTPHAQSQFATPLMSPQSWSQTEWQSPAHEQSGSNWVAHQSWQTQSGLESPYGPTQGLGLHGPVGNNMSVPGQQLDADMRGHRPA